MSEEQTTTQEEEYAICLGERLPIKTWEKKHFFHFGQHDASHILMQMEFTIKDEASKAQTTPIGYLPPLPIHLPWWTFPVDLDYFSPEEISDIANVVSDWSVFEFKIKNAKTNEFEEDPECVRFIELKWHAPENKGRLIVVEDVDNGIRFCLKRP